MFSASTHTFSPLENSKWETLCRKYKHELFSMLVFPPKVSKLHGKDRC